MKSKRIFSFCLALLLLGSSLALAEEPAAEASDDGVLHIRNEEDFQTFRDNCVLDAYSKDLRVVLDCDLDLSGKSSLPIPIFSGSFDGNGHTVSGFLLASDGSHLGLFRYVSEGAEIKNLHMTDARLVPDNSRSQIGCIAGVNRGTLENCSAEGLAEGVSYIGGIAGVNTGKILNCSFSGEVNGKRFTGGIAGYSSGLISGCENRGSVNIRITEGTLDVNEVDLGNLLSGLSLVSVTDTNVVSDTGGICGCSQGVITDCRDSGQVGYPHYGYNVGGIVGRQSGYVHNCVNEAYVQGRKDVGGIVGQMEPFLILQQQQTLKDAITALTGSINGAISGLSSGVGQSYEIMSDFQNSVNNVMDQFERNPETGFPQLKPGADIGPDIANMNADVSILNSIIAENADVTAANLRVVTANMTMVMGLIANTLDKSVSLISYDDISATSLNEDEQDVDGKVSSCENAGTIEGDTCIGGIVGAMDIENEQDMEGSLTDMLKESLDVNGISMLSYRAKCVSIRNVNTGEVISRKDKTGGVTGSHSIGTLVYCENYGSVFSEGSYTGGVVGRSSSGVDKCWSCCNVTGQEYVGGIAGMAKTVTSCAADVTLDGVTACCGSIAGYVDFDTEEDIRGNLYVENGIGAIDGISYAGLAEATDRETLTADESLPLRFRTPPTPPPVEETPPPEKLSTIESEELRPDTVLPLVVLSGDFDEFTRLRVAPYEGDYPVPEHGIVQEAWTVRVSPAGSPYSLRYCFPPASGFFQKEELYLLEEGSWTLASPETLGSYMVLNREEAETVLASAQVLNITRIVWISAAGILLLLLLIFFLVSSRKDRKQRKSANASN